jgi:hypothetical protein
MDFYTPKRLKNTCTQAKASHPQGDLLGYQW